jgi:hypothetical protein
MQHEWRMKQLESDILRVRGETEQLRPENAKEKAFSATIRRLCVPPESSSTLPPATGPDSTPSSP